MKLKHHGLEIELSDDWWAEAEMSSFAPSARSYRVDCNAFPAVCEVRIEDVGPVHRHPDVEIFAGKPQESAREVVLRILRGFRLNTAIPPVEVVRKQEGYGYPYKLVDGTHRFYCSLAAGFTHVPTVEGFDTRPNE